jgi:hypothetical protein
MFLVVNTDQVQAWGETLVGLKGSDLVMKSTTEMSIKCGSFPTY